MEKKLTREERIREKEKLSNIVTAKMAIVFVGLVVAIMLLIRLSEYSVPPLMAVFVSQAVCGVLFFASVIWCVVSFRKGVDNKKTVWSAPFFCGFFGCMLFAALLFTSFDSFRIILSLIAFAVVFFVYEIYAFDFFLCTLSTVVGCVSAAAVSAGFGEMYKSAVNITAIAISAVVSVLCFVLVYRLNANGKLKFGKSVVKKPSGGTHPLIYVGIVASLLVAAFAVFFGHLLYCIAAVCVIYFINAIIYTVKLM